MTTPLEGTKVVELGEGIAAPYCGMELGDAGADVMKIERLRGDTSRAWPPFVQGQSATFLGLNRNKRSIALDWETPAGREVLQRLIEPADVLIEDLGPGRSDSPGLGFSQISETHPRLVHCSISAFGESGPFRDRPGSELVAQAMSEMTSSLGAIGEAPVRLGTDAASTYTGYFSFTGILAALFERNRSGRGQRVWTSLLGSCLFMRGTLWTAHSNPDEWYGFHLDNYVKPREYGYTSRDGQFYFAFMRAIPPDTWTSFLTDLDLSEMEPHPDWAHQGREVMTSGRHAHRYREVWDARFSQLTVDEIAPIVQRHGGDLWRLNDYETLFAHPQTQFLDLVAEIDHSTAGKIQTTAIPWKLEDTPGSIRLSPPLLGQHSLEILEEAGYSAEESTRLRDAGVVAW